MGRGGGGAAARGDELGHFVDQHLAFPGPGGLGFVESVAEIEHLLF